LADDLYDGLSAALREIDPTHECVVDHGSDDRSHWFRGQLIDIAYKYGYFCDTTTYHQWSRLKILQRGGSDDQTVEIVVSLHCLGRSFSGVLALSGFIADRDRDDYGRPTMGSPHEIADRPISFTYAEAFENVRQRCQEWLDMALNITLERFRKTL